MSFVTRFLKRIGIKKQDAVLNLADAKCLGKRVKNVKYIGKANVYCLDVPSTHCFLANGIVVHNCLDSLRYAMYTHFFDKEQGSISAEQLDTNWRESIGGPQFNSPFFDPTRF